MNVYIDFPKCIVDKIKNSDGALIKLNDSEYQQLAEAMRNKIQVHYTNDKDLYTKWYD